MELEEVLQLKEKVKQNYAQECEKLKQEYEKETAAIDIVAKLLEKPNSISVISIEERGGENLSETSHLETDIENDTEDDASGETGNEGQIFVRPMVRKIKNQLPSLYTKHDVKRILLKNEPKFKGKVLPSALYGATQMLVREGFAKEVEKGAGRKAAVYRRLSEDS